MARQQQAEPAEDLPRWVRGCPRLEVGDKAREATSIGYWQSASHRQPVRGEGGSAARGARGCAEAALLRNQAGR